MNAIKTFAFAAAAVATVAGFASQAQAETTWGRNDTKNPIWVTVYLYGGHSVQVGYYCLMPGQTNLVDDGRLGNVGDNGYVRAEVKKGKNKCDDTIHDFTTTVPMAYQKNRGMLVFTASQKDAKPTTEFKWK